MNTIKYIALLFILVPLLIPVQPVQGYHISDSYVNILEATISFEIYEGQYLFVDGMATDCGHCQNQHSVLEDLYLTHGDQMQMLSLAIWSRESIDHMKDFVNDYDTPWHAGHDPDQSFANSFDIEGTPTMIIFGPTGLEITRWVGETSLAKLQTDLNYIINNDIVQSETTFEQNIGNNVEYQPSIVEQLFTSPLFQGIFVVSCFVLIFFKSTKQPES